MTKHIILPLCSLALAGALAGCSENNNVIFDESSANRLENALTEYASTLCASTDGWAMEYFTNSNEPGYVYLLDFDTNGAVTIGARNRWMGGEYRAERSAYKFIADNGPVLSLSSFNTVFHVMCDPIDVPGTAENELGYGHKGDYEFVVMSCSPDEVVLKGKKYGQRILMHPVPQGTDWVDYMDQLTSFGNKLFNSRFEPLILSIDGTRYGTVTNMNNGVMNIVRDGDDALMQTETANFIVRPDGIRFSSTYHGKEGAFDLTTMVFDETIGMLRTPDTDPQQITLSAGPLADIVLDQRRNWRISLTEIGGRFAELMQEINDQTKNVLKRNFQSLDIVTVTSGFPTPIRAISFRMSGSSAAAYVYGTGFIGEGSDITTVNFDTTNGNANGLRRLGDIPSLKTFIELLNSTEFELSAESRLAPNPIRLQSRTNPSDYIVLSII